MREVPMSQGSCMPQTLPKRKPFIPYIHNIPTKSSRLIRYLVEIQNKGKIDMIIYTIFLINKNGQTKTIRRRM